jgi:hypothetical protein
MINFDIIIKCVEHVMCIRFAVTEDNKGVIYISEISDHLTFFLKNIDNVTVHYELQKKCKKITGIVGGLQANPCFCTESASLKKM